MTEPPSPLTMRFSRHTKRREFIISARRRGGGVADCGAGAASARMRRIGVLYILPTDYWEQLFGIVFNKLCNSWDGPLIKICTSTSAWRAGIPADVVRYASELVALAPDAILAVGSATVAPLQRETRTIPIVFVNVADPVGAGLVESMSRPGGNTTGFTNFGVQAWLGSG